MRARSLGWLVWSICGCGIATGSAAEPPPRYPYRMLISDLLTEKILILEKAGSASWELSQPGWVMDGERLPSGNTVIVNFLGHGKDGKGISILEVTPQKQIVWSYREPRIRLLMQLLR